MVKSRCIYPSTRQDCHIANGQYILYQRPCRHCCKCCSSILLICQSSCHPHSKQQAHMIEQNRTCLQHQLCKKRMTSIPICHQPISYSKQNSSHRKTGYRKHHRFPKAICVSHTLHSFYTLSRKVSPVFIIANPYPYVNEPKAFRKGPGCPEPSLNLFWIVDWLTLIS